MWIEITDKVIDLPGIFIIKDNPVTAGAWSMLPTTKQLVIWIHQKRYTAELVKSAIGEKCTFNITDNKEDLVFCGSKSGRTVNKLEKILIEEKEPGYKSIMASYYTILATVKNTIMVGDFYLVVCSVDKIINETGLGGWNWVNIKVFI